ncbi:hypothetical protein CSUI_009190 [Cystoisospora suis]|uniref:Uncharacterized protein n=1 Tax=Cystoisospora suis TaxID=483139 RepID=A0A2C6KKQ4_9APIC|nr:hypothetical protein CSUI_009190 [Cystoisospora suis]
MCIDVCEGQSEEKSFRLIFLLFFWSLPEGAAIGKKAKEEKKALRRTR